MVRLGSVNVYFMVQWFLVSRFSQCVRHSIVNVHQFRTFTLTTIYVYIYVYTHCINNSYYVGLCLRGKHNKKLHYHNVCIFRKDFIRWSIFLYRVIYRVRIWGLDMGFRYVVLNGCSKILFKYKGSNIGFIYRVYIYIDGDSNMGIGTWGSNMVISKTHKIVEL